MKNKDPPKCWINISKKYSILYYTLLYYKAFLKQKLSENTQKLFYKIKIKTMKTAQISADIISANADQTIDLANILWVAPMKPIQETIKIKIEKILTKNEWIQEIPVRILNQPEELWFWQLEDLVTFNLASKSEFRYWKKIRSFFSL